jgi:hypothetical protein
VDQPKRDRTATGLHLDRNGASGHQRHGLYRFGQPRQVQDVQAFARILAPILDMEESAIIKKASDRSKGGVILKRQLTGTSRSSCAR